MSADNNNTTPTPAVAHQPTAHDEKPAKTVDPQQKGGAAVATMGTAPHTPVTQTITGAGLHTYVHGMPQMVHHQSSSTTTPAGVLAAAAASSSTAAYSTAATQHYMTGPAYSSHVMHQQTGFGSPHYGSYSTGGGYYQSQQMASGAAQYHHHHMTGAATTSTTTTTSAQARVIAERIIEHEVKVPKKVVREDVVEKVIVIPEKIVHEEVIEDVQKIREKIIEVAMPVVQERIVEVPEIEYIEKIVEVPEIIYQEKIREVPRIEIQERIVEVPKIIMQEKIVEVPEIEYHDVPVEKIVEVQEIREQVVIKEVPVAQYVEKPVPEYVDVQKEQDIVRSIPIPVEAITTCEFKLPKIRPQYVKVDVPLYVPRFVEVPIPIDIMDNNAIVQSELYAQQVTQLASQSAVSMCEIESLAGTIKSTNFDSMIGHADPSQLITQHWLTGKLPIDPVSMQYTTTTTQQTANFMANEVVTTGAASYTPQATGANSYYSVAGAYQSPVATTASYHTHVQQHQHQHQAAAAQYAASYQQHSAASGLIAGATLAAATHQGATLAASAHQGAVIRHQAHPESVLSAAAAATTTTVSRQAAVTAQHQSHSTTTTTQQLVMGGTGIQTASIESSTPPPQVNDLNLAGSGGEDNAATAGAQTEDEQQPAESATIDQTSD